MVKQFSSAKIGDIFIECWFCNSYFFSQLFHGYLKRVRDTDAQQQTFKRLYFLSIYINHIDQVGIEYGIDVFMYSIYVSLFIFKRD